MRARPRAKEQTRRRDRSFVTALALAICGLFASTSPAADPAWWNAQGAVTANVTPNPNAVVNQGQLKQFTVTAVAELNADLAGVGGAGDTLNNLVTTWQQDYATNNYATDPNNPARPYKPADFDAVTVGQLKYIASLIYAPLVAVGYTTAPAWLTANPATDHSLAVLGQLKAVFNFDLTAVTPANDSNGDGLPDWWEEHYFGTLNVNPNAPAPNGEGMTILQAFQQGINPVDFYAGQTPSLSIVSGNNQPAAAPSSFLQYPLVVQVVDLNGNPIAGAPVTFAVVSGGGLLQATRQASSKATASVLTNGNGQAQVFFQVSSTARVTSGITATLTGTNPAVQGAFSETSDPNGPTNPTPTDPNNPPIPQQVPVQSYACLDMSGAVQGNSDVDRVALDDSGTAAFGFNSDDNTYTTYQYSSGQPTHVQDLTLETDDGMDELIYQPQFIDSQGTIYGAGYKDTTDDEGNVYGIWGTAVIYQNGYANLIFPPSPFQLEPGQSESALWLDFGYAANGCYSGWAGSQIAYTPSGSGTDYEFANAHVINANGSTVLFYDPSDRQLDGESSDPTVQVVYQYFGPKIVNKVGSAIGPGPSGSDMFWDGTSGGFTSFGYGSAIGLNDQNQVVVDTTTEGYLWENSGPVVLANHLPAELAGQISNIQPTAISNQTTPGTDATIYILATATVNGAANTTIVCTRDNDGVWSFAQVGLPDGVTVNQYATINSSGTIAGIGSVSDNSTTSSAIHTNASPSPSPSPSPTQNALNVPQSLLTLKYAASGDYNPQTQILYGYRSLPKGSITDNTGVNTGGIWRDMQCVDTYTFKDGSTLTCTSGWLSDTPSRKVQGGGENGKLVWVDNHLEGDQPTLPANLFCDVSDVASLTEDCYMRWFLILYINNNPVPASECDTHYFTAATLGKGGLSWNAQSSNSTPKFPKDSATGSPAKFQPAQPRIEDEGDSESLEFVKKKKNWVASGGRAAQYLQRSNLE